MNLLYLGIGIHPIGSSKIKLWHFHANRLYYSFSRGLKFLFDIFSLYYFKAKVLRVLLQLESPNSEHRDSSYVRNNPNYSMIKIETRICLAHGPILSEFLGYLEPEFDDSYFFKFGAT